MGKQIYLGDLSSILYSSHGSSQNGVLWNMATGEDIDSGTIDYLVANYSDAPVYRILAQDDDIVIYTDMMEV